MIHAYDKNYLSRAQTSLGVMFHFAVYDAKESLESFYDKFLVSPISQLFEKGDTSTLAGKSGIELALEVIKDSTKGKLHRPIFDRSPEYWTGWALAYFQWYSSLGFAQINTYIPIKEIYQMYMPYHEMDISQFCDQMIRLYNERKPATNLKLLRMQAGLSQSQLATLSEVPVRTIQQYEQRQKRCNAASAETLLRIARVLSCSIEDLMEVELN